MNEIRISEKISYIPASENPLSADVGIIRDGGKIWLFDVGAGVNNVPNREDGYYVVLSHFHKDHTDNLSLIPTEEVYVSKETRKHVGEGTIVQESISVGNLRVFPIPSGHAKGCLGLEVDETFAFVGDALYGREKDGRYVFNAQLLKEEIEVLKKLKAPFLLVSHCDGLVREKEEVIKELEAVYAMRSKNEPEIEINSPNH